MKLSIILLSLALSFISSFAVGEEIYTVTGTKVNVRKYPTIKSTIIGSLHYEQEVEVISITDGWANILYQGKLGFVNMKYLKLSTSKSEAETQVETKEVISIEEENINDTTGFYKTETSTAPPLFYEHDDITTPWLIYSHLPSSMNLYLTGQAGAGWSSFIWKDGDVNGSFAFTVNILAQLYFNKQTSFIPKNWYCDFSLGYKNIGAAKLNLHYIHLGITPFGYDFKFKPLNLLVKAALDLSYPLTQLRTSTSSWNTKFEIGIIGGLEAEWRQWSAGINVLYDFNEVSTVTSTCLHNVGILGILSYKFGKLKENNGK